MARIIPLAVEGHRDIQLQLPWYAAGKLEPAEHARVEAHLAVCPDCRAELAGEQRLEAEIASLTPEVAHGWDRLQARLEPRSRGNRVRARGGLAWLQPGVSASMGMSWQGWAIAAQAAVLVLISGGLLLRENRPATYVTLGEKAAPVEGNALVMFRPDTPESSLRAALIASNARLVDGPTPAGAYVLQVPAQRRGASLAVLKRRAEVTLAEPLDAAAPP